MDDIQKKILLQIDLESKDTAAAVDDLTSKINALKASVVGNKDAITTAKAAQAEYAAQLGKAKLDHQAVKKAIDEERLARLKANDAIRQSKQNLDAAKGSYDAAQKNLTALGRAIKSAEGGFDSTNPKIQKQILQYNALNNKLKAFDTQLGNHQRNVGNYEKSLSGLDGIIEKIIPNYSQFSAVLQGAAKAFNAVKSSSKAAGDGVQGTGMAAQTATEGVEGLSAELIGLVAAAAAVIGIIAVVVNWFAQLTPNAEKLEQRMSGVKGAFSAFMSDIGKGVGFKELWTDMKNAYNEAGELTKGMQDLSRQTEILSVANAEADTKIADIQLKMRNRRITPAQELAYFNQIQAIAKQSHDERKKLADTEFDLAVKMATTGRKFTDDIRDNILKNGVTIKDAITGQISYLKAGAEAAAYYDKQLGLRNKDGKGTDLDKIAKAQQAQDSAERFQQTIDDRAQNRLDAKNMKAEAEAAKAKNDLLEAQRAAEELINERKAANAKILQDQMHTFTRELSMQDEQYRQLIFKQEDFIKKQEQLRNKTKSPAAKAQYTKNISGAKDLIGLYSKEHAADQEKLVTEYFRAQAQAVEKGQEELASLQAQNIQNVKERELAALKAQFDAQQNGYQQEFELRKENIAKLQRDVKSAKGQRLAELKEQLDKELDLEGISYDKSEVALKKYEHDRAKIIKDAADKEREEIDQTAVLKAQNNQVNNPNSNKAAKDVLDAEKKSALDRYSIAISQEGVTNAQKKLLYQQYLNEIQSLDKGYNERRAQQIMQWEHIIQQGATDIIKNAIRSNAEYALVNLEKQKTHELNNQALTTTQKTLVEEKYRKKEGQAKVKEFRDNQKLSIAQALINGALAMTKTTANTGFPLAFAFDPIVAAQTAVEIAVIAAQKPPAYATGGVHVGNGAVKGAGTGKSDSINARLSNGESVINAKSTEAFGPLLSAINIWGGGKPFTMPTMQMAGIPGFATGGVFSYAPTIDNGLRTSSSTPGRMHPDDVNSIVTGLGNAIASIPVPIVDVKDVAYQQERISTVVDRANY